MAQKEGKRRCAGMEGRGREYSFAHCSIEESSPGIIIVSLLKLICFRSRLLPTLLALITD